MRIIKYNCHCEKQRMSLRGAERRSNLTFPVGLPRVLRTLAMTILLLFLGFNIYAANPGDVVINEIAWMGTDASSTDEWIELYNNTDSTINLSGWKLYEKGGDIEICTLVSSISAGGYYLIERTDDNTVSDIPGDYVVSFGGSGLANDGEHLVLKDDSGITIDEIDCSGGWFAGDNDYKITMEKIYPDADGNSDINWADNDRNRINGKDADGNPIYGTPRQKNSVSYIKEVDTGRRALKVTDSPFFPHNDNSAAEAKGMISYKVKENSYVTLAIYDINGYVIKYLKHDVLLGAAEAQGTVFWKGTDTYDNIVPVGIYIVHLKAEHRDTGVVKTAEATIIVGRKF